MRKNGLLIVLFTCLLSLFGIISCTYDYFEDETNYQVYVPEVVANSITDCRVMVYTEDGVLVKERYAVGPSWGSDPREQTGLFSFRLPPGKYQVYCYTNTDSITFSDVRSLETAAFHLNEKPGVANTHVHPSDILYQKLTPAIIHPGMLKIDTAAVEKYTGRITVRFKNFPANQSLVSHVELNAKGAAVMQQLKHVDETCRRASAPDFDVMHHWGELPTQDSSWGYLEVDHMYLPTVDDGGIAELEYKFLDSTGGTVITLPVMLAQAGVPLRLLPGQRIIIEIDSYTIISMTIVGWDEDILGDGGETGIH